MRTRLSLALLTLCLASCGLFSAKDPSRSAGFAPQYAGVDGASVAIVVYVSPATANEYAGARDEISAFIASQLREHLPHVRLLAPREVMNWQDDTLNWQALPEQDIGKHFGVDRVLFVEVLEYSTRPVLTYSNMQGRLRAQCRITECNLPSPTPPVSRPADSQPTPEPAPITPPVWTGLIDASWPPNHPLDPTQTNESAVRLHTLESFADRLVSHFYEK